MYSIMFGYNPLAPLLLTTLNLSPEQVGRFRDAFVSEGKIAVYTRNGGGNRDDYQHIFDSLRKHPLYLSDEDDSYDSTYCMIWFKVPEEYVEDLKKVDVGKLDMRKRWEEALEKVKARDPEILARSAPMVDQFRKAFGSGEPVTIITTGRDPKKVLDDGKKT